MISHVTAGYADLHAWENLLLAYSKAARGKRSQAPVARFEFMLGDNLIGLSGDGGAGAPPADGRS